MRYLDKVGLEHFWNELKKYFVKKESGKGLSTNDYNNIAKSKVDAIPDNPKYSDTVYDDTELRNLIPTDIHINELINSALGVIEHGYY